MRPHTPRPDGQGRRFCLETDCMEWMTREVFDTLIVVVIMIGLALAGIRLYRDFTRPMPDIEADAEDPDAYDPGAASSDDDTRPGRPQNSQ